MLPITIRRTKSAFMWEMKITGWPENWMVHGVLGITKASDLPLTCRSKRPTGKTLTKEKKLT